ncbi:SDR family oxidoreductase [Mangrovibacterium lignilyticum]|uniref:SDR family oxidoreductase n=1 Tax=Mangrovibacterium lignilyticum TaxID=2668052 RepID=UPI0013D4C26D|nr:SDR family oxidoreductase [Mangrovibacterium lignilyticum]
MKILLTGVTGYIGKRLLPVLVDQGHQIVCSVRDERRFSPANSIRDKIEIIENDFTRSETLGNIPEDIEFAYYLIHSMSGATDFDALEKLSAVNFRDALAGTQVRQVIYLSGIVNSETLSKHLQSRKTVEDELKKGTYALTTLRAGIIIGSGSASFEIIRDLVEKLPVMIAPRWLNTRCQPIAIRDVIKILTLTLNNEATFHRSFDIAGKEILTYKEMLLEFAKVRGLKRYVGTVPVMTPQFSSYWLYFVTSTSYKLATALVDSMKVEVVARDQELVDLLGIEPLSYEEAIVKAFKKIEQNEIVSSWKDSTISGRLNYQISDFINVPTFGCFRDIRRRRIADLPACIERIWRIGGDNGWYFGDWLWRIRGFMDELTWGVGLRRGRTSVDRIQAGDTLDFWRVLYANKAEGRLLLFAEMKIPGEAWLEFRVDGNELVQTATFRPRGVGGRLYWAMVYPFHGYIFSGLLRKLTE